MIKIYSFIKSHFLLIFLVLYGIFIVVFRSTGGSFDCDEGIYSQVAREGLANNSILSLYWKGQLWFEKPPLMIWLTMLSFKVFGISEFSSHLFSGIFGVLGAVITYFLGKEVFKSNLAGFFSGFVLLTTPLYIWSMRSNMMDTALSFFISVSIFALWKSIYINKKWLLLFWLGISFAVMAKSIAGLLPVIVMVPLLFVFKKAAILKDRYFCIGIVLFTLIVFPWHIYMSFLYGDRFWDEYIGYHVIKRFTYPIINTPWDNNPFSYFSILFQRSGIWPFMLIILSSVFYRTFLNQKERMLFLGIWFFSIILIFSALATKLPQYLIPIYMPMSLMIGGVLFQLQENKSKILLPLALISLLNFFPFFFFPVSNYGESHLLVPKIFTYFFHFNENMLGYVFVISGIILILSSIILSKEKLSTLALTIIVVMAIAIPFNPQRNFFIKEIGINISRLSGQQPLTVYLKDSGAIPIGTVIPFYLPLGSKVERYKDEEISFDSSDMNNSVFCFFEKQFMADNLISKAVYYNQTGFIVPCYIHTN